MRSNRRKAPREQKKPTLDPAIEAARDNKMNSSRVYGRWHRILAKFFLWLYRVRVHHLELEPDAAPAGEHYLLCSNHLSAMDPILLAAALQKQQPHFMGKKELFRIPILSSVMRAFGAYPVDRAGDIGAIKTSVELLSAGQCVGIFPQGTRCPGKPPRDTLEAVKPGAGLLCERTRVTVLPACLKAKGDRIRPFCGVDLVFGAPLSYADLAAEMEAQEPALTTHQAKYAWLSRRIFGEICRLYEQEVPREPNNDKTK